MFSSNCLTRLCSFCLFFQILDFSNWDENEEACEEQQISIETLNCVENNITNCSDNFTLSYYDAAITMSLQYTNSTVLEKRLNEMQAFQGIVTINVTLANTTVGNTTVFRVLFCSSDPRGIDALNGTVADSQALMLNITVSVQGQSAKDFQLVFDQPDLPSNALTPSSSKQSIEQVLEDWFSRKCDSSPKSKWNITELQFYLRKSLVSLWLVEPDFHPG